MRSRHGEALKTWFRSARVYRCNERWYFHTREGIPVGPYLHRSEAEDDSELLVRLLRNHSPDDSRRLIRDFLMRSGGEIDLVNDPAFTSYASEEDEPLTWNAA
jgi:hypothetical protein